MLSLCEHGLTLILLRCTDKAKLEKARIYFKATHVYIQTIHFGREFDYVPKRMFLPVSVLSVSALFLQTSVTFSSPNENTQFERLRKT